MKINKSVIKRISRVSLKVIGVAMSIALLAVVATSVSPVYNFPAGKPFSGPDIFNPYRDIDTAYCWKRANFHTHTRVEGIFNECQKWPQRLYDEYQKYGYDIVTFSNHNELTEHPFDKELQVDLYEHDYNLLKFHKLVFGSDKVNRFDHLLPIFTFQRQYQLDLLRAESDIIVLNHPLRTPLTTKGMMEKLSGYDIIELDSGKSTENEYWDWALSAGHYSFGLANDDMHYPDRSNAIAVRCNFLCCPSAKYEDIKATLLGGCYYAMRVPDYGQGDWNVKIERNRELPYITNIGVEQQEIFLALSTEAVEIKLIGEDHKLLATWHNSAEARYTLPAEEPYARFIIYFAEGEVIYTNPFARYDATLAESPFREGEHSVNIALTLLYNFVVLALVVAIIFATYRYIINR